MTFSINSLILLDFLSFFPPAIFVPIPQNFSQSAGVLKTLYKLENFADYKFSKSLVTPTSCVTF